MTQGAQEAVVRGPEELVRRVVAAMAEVDLQGQTVNLATTLTLNAVDNDGGPVEGVIVTPETVSVRVPIVAQFGIQQVSVVPALEGRPAPGFAVGRIDWEPKIVEVFTSGVVTTTLATAPVNLDGLSSGITQTVLLQHLPNVITRPQTVPVTVSVEIVPISVPSQLPLLVPVSPTNLGEGLSAPAAEPASVQVTLAGPFEQLSQLANTPGAVVATVDLRDLGPGTYNLPVQITVPPGLQLVSPGAPVVSVTIYPPATPTPQSSPSPASTSTAEPIELSP
jgi:YbbR domain-containing protein